MDAGTADGDTPVRTSEPELKDTVVSDGTQGSLQ